jgi:hypothetical protein
MRRLGLVAIAAVVTLSACGGGSGSDGGASAAPTATGVGAAKLIASSVDTTAAAKTARMNGEVTITVGGDTATLPLDGALDFETGAFESTYDMSQLGIPGAGDSKVHARMVDGVMYMNLGDLGGDADESLSTMTDGKSWMKLDLGAFGQGSTGGVTGLGDADPSGTLEALRGAGEVETVGTDTLRGVETTHYRAMIDPQKALDEAPANLREQGLKGLDELGGPVPVDVWIDGDGQTRKISMDIDAKSGRVATTIEYYDFGTDVDVSAPPADDVFDLRDLFGGLGKMFDPSGSVSEAA